MTNKLLPCLFCGETPSHFVCGYEWVKEVELNVPTVYIECYNPRCSVTPKVKATGETAIERGLQALMNIDYEPAKQKAIEIWNTRK